MNPTSIASRADGPANPPSQAECAMNRIENIISRLEDRAAILSERLAPVLSSATKGDGNDADRPSSSIPLVQAMDACTDRLGTLASRLEDVLDRLAL